jgi:hypothetical protein
MNQLTNTSPMTLADFSLPPEIMLQAACGMEAPIDVLTRHLEDEEKARSLLANPAFLKQLEAKQTELLAGGVTTRLKAAMFAHDLLDDLYVRGKSSQTATSAVIDITKTLAKLGDLEPKQTVQAGGNAGFSIQIVLPGSSTPVEIGINSTPAQTNFTENKQKQPQDAYLEAEYAFVEEVMESSMFDLDREF